MKVYNYIINLHKIGSASKAHREQEHSRIQRIRFKASAADRVNEKRKGNQTDIKAQTDSLTLSFRAFTELYDLNNDCD